MPWIDAGSQSTVVTALREMVFPRPLQLPRLGLRDQVFQPSPVLCVRRPRNFTAVSRALHQLCRAISVRTAWVLYLVSQFSAKRTTPRCAKSPSPATASCWICSAIVNELVHTRTRFMAGKLESNMDPVPTCRRSRSSQALPSLKDLYTATLSNCCPNASHIQVHVLHS